MATRPASVSAYLDSLPADRRDTVEAIRAVIRKNLDPAFEEGIQYGMIGYFLPHSVYPAGYHCDPKQPLPFASIASQKNHIGIYLFCVYGDEDVAARFREEWLATGKRLDMGKSCVRVKKLEDVPLPVLGRTIKRVTAKKFVARYEALVGRDGGERAAAKPKPAKKRATKRTATRKPAANKAPARRGSKRA